MRNQPVRRMRLKEFLFGSQSFFHAFILHDVLLRSVDDANKSQLQWVHSSSKYFDTVGPTVHKIEFGEDAKSATPFRIDSACEFERVGICKVYISRRDGKDDTEIDRHWTRYSDRLLHTNLVSLYNQGLVSESAAQYLWAS